MVKVSVITINYNNKAGLKRTLDSLFSQVMNDFEIIVVDGGSTDGSKELLLENQSRLAYWVAEKDGGIFNAQNKGIDQATGEYLLFLNSGDILADEYVFKKVSDAGLDADIVYGDMYLKEQGKEAKKLLQMPDKINWLHLLKDTVWHPVSFIRKKLFDQYGKYNEHYRIVSDYEFFVRVIQGKKVSTKHVSVAVAVFETGGMSSAPENKEQVIAERNEIQDRYFNKITVLLFRMYSRIRN